MASEMVNDSISLRAQESRNGKRPSPHSIGVVRKAFRVDRHVDFSKLAARWVDPSPFHGGVIVVWFR